MSPTLFRPYSSWAAALPLLIAAGCGDFALELAGWPCEVDDDCVAGFVCNPSNNTCEATTELCVDQDRDEYGEGPGCIAADCDDSAASCTTDCADADSDARPDCADTCIDADGDGVGNGTNGNTGCAGGTANDPDDGSPIVCGDRDGDTCDDCALGGGFSPSNDGADFDGDGLCDVGDPDDDNDGVEDSADSNPLNAAVCQDLDNDSCDDCSQTNNPPDPNNDGPDADADGQCDATDQCTDADGDGLGNGNANNAQCVNSTTDSDDANGNACADTDGDACDDCSLGAFNPAADGPDGDSDTICDVTDTCNDADGDDVGSGLNGNTGCGPPSILTTIVDTDDTNNRVCGDTDGDGCDDCGTQGVFNPFNDAADFDGDGICDANDPDQDGDGVNDVDDVAPRNRNLCRDLDGDTCDDCSQTYNPPDPNNDGDDADGDGLCDAGDTCQDKDGDGVGNGNLGNVGCLTPVNDSNDVDANLCADTDNDTCNDCSNGTFDIRNDGPDADNDGQCDNGDTCTDVDSDGLGNGGNGNVDCDNPATDTNDLSATVCGDTDGDSCDDCSIVGKWNPGNDGRDVDLDGLCVDGDTCVDVDGDQVGNGNLGNTGCVTPLTDLDDDKNKECLDTDGDSCNDCSSGTFNPDGDGPDADSDGQCDNGDTCTDVDGDGVGNGNLGNVGCTATQVTDSDDNNANACADTDSDTCNDCSSGRFEPDNDGTDTDGDGSCNNGDADDDNDTIIDTLDVAPLDATRCQDLDNDTCDDCAGPDVGPNPATDGTDTDGDGACDAGDTDDDNDGVEDSADIAPLDATRCQDLDNDSCDDCSQTRNPPDVGNDGTDTDGDGQCNVGDNDDDGDTVLDVQDTDPLNPNVCRDVDSDQCDDCALTGGPPNAANDGDDSDGDNRCNVGDTDDDNDGVLDTSDLAPLNPNICADSDNDLCDDCSVNGGPPATNNDGIDTDGDGACNTGDSDDDNDTVLDTVDTDPLDNERCQDADADGCDDCSATLGPPNIANDGLDGDSDGICDVSDTCTDADNDNVGTGTGGNAGCATTVNDSDDASNFTCADTDLDSCDDCSGAGTWDPANDGIDSDGDGRCDAADNCSDADGDGVGNGTGGNAGCATTVTDSNDANRNACADTDNDGCDDCTFGTFNVSNDGTDTDNDGACDVNDPDDDNDSVADGSDLAPLDPFICQDVDADTCDDCSQTGGPPDTSNDGADITADGICDARGWYDIAWGFRKKVTVVASQVSANLTDFPVGVIITDAQVAAAARSDGNDIIFADADGLTLLNHEIERWDATSNELVAWVRVPSVSASTNTDIYMYYGNATATNQENAAGLWDTSYLAVWHLGEDPLLVSSVADSSSFSHNGTPASFNDLGRTTASAAGKVGRAIQFDGTDDLINVGSPATLDDLATFTFEGWMYLDGWGGNNFGRLWTKSLTNGTRPLSLYANNFNNQASFQFDRYHPATATQLRAADGSISLGTWYHVGVIYDLGNNPNQGLYLNGSRVASAGLASETYGSGSFESDASYPVILGNRADQQRTFNGRLDEFRLSSTLRSPAWIGTSFNNQNSPGTFLSIGTQETYP